MFYIASKLLAFISKPIIWILLLLISSIIFNSNTIYSKPIAKVQKGRLFLIKKCKYGWCKVSSEKYTGWIKKKFLWGSTN